MPINQIHGIHFEIAQLVAKTPFDDEQDYDNYVARLRKVPRLFSQLADNMGCARHAWNDGMASLDSLDVIH
jgi:uncharacterized protein (DUF885 family)